MFHSKICPIKKRSFEFLSPKRNSFTSVLYINRRIHVFYYNFRIIIYWRDLSIVSWNICFVYLGFWGKSYSIKILNSMLYQAVRFKKMQKLLNKPCKEVCQWFNLQNSFVLLTIIQMLKHGYRMCITLGSPNVLSTHTKNKAKQVQLWAITCHGPYAKTGLITLTAMRNIHSIDWKNPV